MTYAFAQHLVYFCVLESAACNKASTIVLQQMAMQCNAMMFWSRSTTSVSCTGNATALAGLLFGSAFLNEGSTWAQAQNLTSTISAGKLSPQVLEGAFQSAILQSLQLSAGEASADVTATLVAAAVGAQQASVVAPAFAQVHHQQLAVLDISDDIG